MPTSARLLRTWVNSRRESIRHRNHAISNPGNPLPERYLRGFPPIFPCVLAPGRGRLIPGFVRICFSKPRRPNSQAVEFE